MKSLSRRILLAAAGVLAVADTLLVWRSLRPVYAAITYVGVDSVGMELPVSKRGASLKGGKWQPPLSEAQLRVRDMMGTMRPLTLVTLNRSAPFGNLIEVIKNLRAQGKCHVLIRGSDEEGAPPYLPGLVLCGQAIGDAGFSGTLPPDGAD